MAPLMLPGEKSVHPRQITQFYTLHVIHLRYWGVMEGVRGLSILLKEDTVVMPQTGNKTCKPSG